MPWVILVSCAALMLAGIFLTVLIRTLRCRPAENASTARYEENADLSGAQKLAEMVRIPTVSRLEQGQTDWAAFQRFLELLETLFPLVHQKCEKTVVNGYSLMYCLKSEGAGPKGKPILITAHMDVVPVEEGTEDDWTKPPFCGEIEDGILWGRGTLDTKVHLAGAMEAMERLLQKGFSPTRDIYMAFGHDEELNGEEGAIYLADYLKKKGLDFDFVLDEGGCVVRDVVDGVDRPLALVGIGEKGFANIRLSVTKNGGHASMPAAHTSLGILAQAICRIEAHPFRPRLTPPTKGFLTRISPYMKGVNRMVLANLWLFEPVFLRVFSKTAAGGALLRTTVAATMAQGSPAPNVVPQKSSAVVNCRILPGDNGILLLAHFRKILKGLPVEIEPIHLDDPSALSPGDGEAFSRLESLIEEFCPGAVVAPYLVMACTDARKYECVSKNIYRFTPYVIDSADLGKIHGTNENISVVNVNRCIDFFTALMERL